MRYTIIQEVKSETKVVGNISVYDLLFILGYMMIAYLFTNGVAGQLKILYYIFSGLIAIWLTLPSRVNPKRRFWQSLLLFIKKEKVIYKSLRNEQQELERRSMYNE